MKKLFFILIFSVVAASPAKADPATAAVLAPLALKAAREASPYVISGMRGSGDQMTAVAQDLGRILLLPWGAIQATVGMPFGYMGDGFDNIFTGVCAPFELVYDLVVLPFSFLSQSGI